MLVKPFPLSDSCHSVLIFEGIITQNVLLKKVNLTSILSTSKKSCSDCTMYCQWNMILNISWARACPAEQRWWFGFIANLCRPYSEFTSILWQGWFGITLRSFDKFSEVVCKTVHFTSFQQLFADSTKSLVKLGFLKCNSVL